MDLQQFFIDFQDHLAPKLDTYSQAVYLYIFRHSRLIDLDEVVIGFHSARKRMALGVGSRGTFMALNTCYEKLESLVAKGYVERIGTEQNGTRLHLKLPNEIAGLIPSAAPVAVVDIEQLDFFESLPTAN